MTILKVPNHIAIIPDGNRRWAREKGLKPWDGHAKSVSRENVSVMLKEAKNLGIKYVSIWGFSTENWKRDKREVDYLFKLISGSLDSFKEDFVKEKIRFRHIGRKDRLPKELVFKIDKLEKATKNFSELNFQLYLDYGGRDEIIRAVNKLLVEERMEINEEDFKNYLDTVGIPEPDMIIRTSGEKRLSGLMPFQAGYAELYFTEIYFPDFNAEELKKAVEDFEKRKRRFGGD